MVVNYASNNNMHSFLIIRMGMVIVIIPIIVMTTMDGWTVGSDDR